MKQMKIFKNKLTLNKKINGIKNLSFVPTMGSLHNGHKYLIKKGKKIGNKILVSVYINPKQFNSRFDFSSYPRDIKKDLNFLKKLKVDYVYLPNSKDIYSFKTKHKIYQDKASSILCGKFRKTHFRGVLNVVNRLLEIIKPNYILLGNKDFQQMKLIEMHIKKRKIQTKVVPCKTIREKSGLAYSSRNNNLSIKEKKIASRVYKNLIKFKNIVKKNSNKFKIFDLIEIIKRLGVNKVEYVELLNIKNLQKPKNYKTNFNIFIAYYIRNIRLIDNV